MTPRGKSKQTKTDSRQCTHNQSDKNKEEQSNQFAVSQQGELNARQDLLNKALRRRLGKNAKQSPAAVASMPYKLPECHPKNKQYQNHRLRTVCSTNYRDVYRRLVRHEAISFRKRLSKFYFTFKR